MVSNSLSVLQATRVLSGDHTTFRVNPTATFRVSPVARSTKTGGLINVWFVAHDP